MNEFVKEFLTYEQKAEISNKIFAKLLQAVEDYDSELLKESISKEMITACGWVFESVDINIDEIGKVISDKITTEVKRILGVEECQNKKQ